MSNRQISKTTKDHKCKRCNETILKGSHAILILDGRGGKGKRYYVHPKCLQVDGY